MAGSDFNTKGGSFVRTSVELTEKKTFTIPLGANGSNVNPVDLDSNCKGLVLRCANCVGIPANTTLKVYVGDGSEDTVCEVHKSDGSGVLSFTMPTSGTWRVIVANAFGGRRVRVVLSSNVTAQTVVEVIGVDLGE